MGVSGSHGHVRRHHCAAGGTLGTCKHACIRLHLAQIPADPTERPMRQAPIVTRMISTSRGGAHHITRCRSCCVFLCNLRDDLSLSCQISIFFRLFFLALASCGLLLPYSEIRCLRLHGRFALSATSRRHWKVHRKFQWWPTCNARP